MVECMTFEALNDEKTGAVVGTPRTGVSRAVKWLVCLVLAMMCALWITPYALAEGEGTLTENITDPQNLLGSNASSVSDKIKETKEQTGTTVRLLYVESFGTEVKPVEWATGVLESLSPKPNTVLLAVASGDGKLVVVASSNSDEWLRNKKTVEALSEAATDKLAKSGAQDWSGAAIAMMDEIMLLKKTSTSSSLTVVGIIGLICAVVLLAVGAVLIVLRNRKRHKEAELDAERAAAGKRTRANRRRRAGEPTGRPAGKSSRKTGEKRKGGAAHGNRHGRRGRKDKTVAESAVENVTGAVIEAGGLADEARNDAVAGVAGVTADAAETAAEVAKVAGNAVGTVAENVSEPIVDDSSRFMPASEQPAESSEGLSEATPAEAIQESADTADTTVEQSPSADAPEPESEPESEPEPASEPAPAAEPDPIPEPEPESAPAVPEPAPAAPEPAPAAEGEAKRKHPKFGLFKKKPGARGESDDENAAKGRRKRKRRNEDGDDESVDARSAASDESEPRFHAGDSFMPGDGSVDQSVSDDIEAMFAKPFIPGTRRSDGDDADSE